MDSINWNPAVDGGSINPSQHSVSGYNNPPPPILFDEESASRPHLDAQLERDRAEVDRLRRELKKLWSSHDAKMREAEDRIQAKRDWAYGIIMRAVENNGGILDI